MGTRSASGMHHDPSVDDGNCIVAEGRRLEGSSSRIHSRELRGGRDDDSVIMMMPAMMMHAER